MTETILMCEPKYFDVNYVINPWMKDQVNKIDHVLAKQQWQDFYNNLKQFCTIKLVEPQPNLPDLVFTANAGLVVGREVILSHFRHPERRPEEPIFKHWFEENGYTCTQLPNGIYFEGHGDAIFHSDKSLLWLGYGIRSEIKALDALKKKVSTPIVPLELISEQFYHLDTCFCPLIDGTVIYYPSAFSKESNKLIASKLPKEKRIVINDEDAAYFVCNLVFIKTKKIPGKKGVIFINAATSALEKKLHELNYEIKIQPVTEFRKAGGANQCLTLKLDKD